MPELEAMAIIESHTDMREHKLRTFRANLFTDSETMIKAKRKGHSTKCLMINSAIKLLEEEQTKVHQVKSQHNPADNVSRGIHPNQEDIQKMVDLCSLPKTFANALST